MTGPERVLFHQIHPLKLLTDWASATVSLGLLWQHRLRSGLLVQVAPPIVVSTALLCWADLEPQRRSAFGRYIARSMTPEMQAVRLAGDVVMSVGAWRRRPALLIVGLLLVLFGWLRGALLVSMQSSTHRSRGPEGSAVRNICGSERT